MVPNFPILSAIQLEHSEIAGHRESEDTLNLPMLETLELRFCVDRTKLLSDISMVADHVNEALNLIQTLRL
ncbi:hypothetical protein RDI58_012848 [Solanum bulbocastanum]|uniref:Uncharacterized protein n=1 Tax=Solanum bulbocastanum TaxID=147425 RepID=A0AAN8TLQ8_SOLBU